jgi:acyl-CoA thioester hydrolase
MSAHGNATIRPGPLGREAYRRYIDVPTRWADNDVYGHVNNVVYYSYFDTVVNRYLIEQGVLDIHHGTTIGLVVQTQCHYFSPVAFPETLQAGLRVEYVGRSSVAYGIGLFQQGQPQSAARGHFVHVYVDRQTRRPVTLAGELLRALEALRVSDAR